MFNFLVMLKKSFPLEKIFFHKNEVIIYVNSSNIFNFIKFLKLNELSRYDILVDICCVDYLSTKKRFEVVYHLLSVTYNQRIRIKIYVDEVTPVNSICDLFSSAGWWERESWDMFGVFFQNHPDLRRILTDYGFEGHPFRKDFPLVGFFETRYDDFNKCVVQDKVEFTQEFRVYNYINPWVK